MNIEVFLYLNRTNIRDNTISKLKNLFIFNSLRRYRDGYKLRQIHGYLRADFFWIQARWQYSH